MVLVGLLWFLLIGWMDYASTTVLCYLALFHLIARLLYRNAIHVLSNLNLIEKRPAPEVSPETFVTEEEVLQYLKSATELINTTLRAAYHLAVCDCTPLVLKWITGLYTLALASKLCGTTGLFFIVFVGTFSAPKIYQLKQPQIDRAVEQASAQAMQHVTAVSARLAKSSKELLGMLPTIPKASDLAKGDTGGASNIKPKSL